mmetsp:Transcript_55375/g.120693  ORF Transcript_55375/g.120693 Transcript_55375/m.120693 type:complete len:99 (+) Transcript_55375:525-821(+)
MVDCHTEVPTPFAPLSDATPEEEALVEGTADETMGGHGTQISELSPDDFAEVPSELRQAVFDKVSTELASLRSAMEERFASQEADLVARIEALQQKLK